MEPWQAAAHYHQQTKHDFGRYARSAGFMDWANQPDPFRRYHGAPLIRLPLQPNDADAPSYDDLYVPGAIPPQPIRLESIAGFLQYALALSAWKEFRGSRWALRINPSSGNPSNTKPLSVRIVITAPLTIEPSERMTKPSTVVLTPLPGWMTLTCLTEVAPPLVAVINATPGETPSTNIPVGLHESDRSHGSLGGRNTSAVCNVVAG